MVRNIEFELLAGGQKRWMVTVPGLQAVVIRCVSKEAAYALAEVLDWKVKSIEVKEVIV